MKDLNFLIVEDDQKLAESVKDFLAPLANIEIADNGFDGQALGQDNIYDLVILDLMLPEKSGYDILKHWRKVDQLSFPVLILTAKDALDDKVHGFSLGADDYLTKPFHREELVARIKALLKRSGLWNENEQLTVGPFSANLNDHRVTVNDQPLSLNGKEYNLLIYFLQNPDVIITKEQIFDRLWGFDSDTALSVVEVYMSNLRRKIKKVNQTFPIQTIRNVGYLLETKE